MSSIKALYSDYIKNELPTIEDAQKLPIPTKQQIHVKQSQERQARISSSRERQLFEWNDPEFLQKNEAEFTKDPYSTVFISRLDYKLTELDLSKNFSKFGVIQSIRIIRDKTGKSRGYGFIVFEKVADANMCVKELAHTGIKIPIEGVDSSKTRTILVDIERGRLVRNWKPRRLGGGLGGRHYTRADTRFSNTASAAASGRRLHIANNPRHNYHENQNYNSYNSQNYNSGYNSHNSYSNSYNAPNSYNTPSYNSSSHSSHTEAASGQKPPRDKYAAYTPVAYKTSDSDSARSIRSIRQRE